MSDRIVHIVDDEAPVRASLAFLLMSAGYAVRAHDGGPAFLNAIGDTAGACLVTDLRMPEMNGVELLEALSAKGLHVPAIVITGHGDVPMAVAAMKAGAIDFIEKPFEDAVLIAAIERANASADARGDQGPDTAAIQLRMGQLTTREREILTGIVAGLPNKTIAYDLQISPRTVEVHRANIMTKMQAKSLPELVRMTLTMAKKPI
ncbi:transcriptional regulatory protein fixJ [Asticcacaulis biprosthecium C19]|uniref:Transcriptional regulatory protein fixJ n=1 Tax=Asticcacaulis biprosthecium C19 TaxID=715226 RepID=F4QTH2_9CAUL|nr:response regulator FixJ [Asticcacaulis biprosthecium]EGF90042.1 transcriptional regulatory protein fixJ [Asticcacaulis biprosthecium C19]